MVLAEATEGGEIGKKSIGKSTLIGVRAEKGGPEVRIQMPQI
jgi:hypothetical protein